MTSVTDQTDTPAEGAADAVIYKKAAVGQAISEADTQASKLAALASSGKFRATGRVNTENPWRSGWCGSGDCRDGLPDPRSGLPRQRCLGVGENGANVTPRFVYCACACHTTNPRAVQLATAESTA